LPLKKGRETSLYWNFTKFDIYHPSLSTLLFFLSCHNANNLFVLSVLFWGQNEHHILVAV